MCTRGTLFTAPTMVLENQTATTAPTPYSTTEVLFSVFSHYTQRRHKESVNLLLLFTALRVSSFTASVRTMV